MRSIFYIGYIDTPKSKYSHFVSPAGSSKMRYVAEVMGECGCQVDILSMARPVGVSGFCKRETVEIAPNVSASFSPFIGANSFLLRKICAVFQILSLFFFLLTHVGKKDIVVVYHSLSYASIIWVIRKLLGFTLILEVEEVYSDVKKVYRINSMIERLLFHVSDAFIFPTELLDKKININKKPSIIIYGSYKVSPIIENTIKDGKVHVLYSGTFDTRKGGAYAAIGAAEFLNSDYHIHITGFGTDEDVRKIREAIDLVSPKSSCKVSYDGFVPEKEYLPYIQKFNIGLCTQNPDDVLSTSCFPSKILLYMSNGLSVLSSKAPAVLESKIASDLFFYEEQNPLSIAQSLKRIPLNDDKQNVVKRLDVDCKYQMKHFLSNL